MKEKLTIKEKTHLRQERIITDRDRQQQAEWMLQTEAISGKPACWECYFALRKLGYIKH